MNICFTKEDILTPLSLAVTAAQKSAALSIMETVLLSVSNDKIAITGRNDGIQVTAKGVIAMPSGDAIKLAVPGKKFYDVIRLSPDGQVFSMTQDGGKVTVKAGKSRYQMNSYAPEDFPVMVKEKPKGGFFIEPNELIDAIDSCQHVCAVNDVRTYLNGMCVDMDTEGNVAMVATNGHVLVKLSEKRVSNGDARSIIVPLNSLRAIKKSFSGEKESIRFLMTDHCALIVGQEIEVTSVLLDGKFPMYQKVIPVSLPNAIALKRAEIKAALERARIFKGDDKKGAVNLLVNCNELSIRAGGDDGDAEDTIPMSYTGEPRTIRLCMHYLENTVASFHSEDVCIHFGDELQVVAVMEKGVQLNSAHRLHIITPMRG